MADLVLASGSPRRSLLLSTAGYAFRTTAPDVDETQRDGEEPAAMVLRLSEDKARAVSADPHEVVLAADTIVVLDGVVMGKPVDREDATRMLGALSGATHSVLTGWTVIRADEERFGVTESRVEFHPLDTAEIDRYIEDTQPWDKAGAYAIQGDRGRLIRAVSGSRANVMGLPLGEIAEALGEFGVTRSAPDGS
ncbi:MAG: Maf family protein [Acidimicrobiia bacterium]